MQAAGLPAEQLIRISTREPLNADRAFAEVRNAFPGAAGLSHLVAIERVGPSHTLESLCSQQRAGPTPTQEFERLCPAASRNHCHNMRGEIIDEFSGELHRLFEELPQVCPGAQTIGIGDGGNEIGMGAIPWEELARRLSGDAAARIPCRIAADWNIIAGTSNWGAMALAAATLLLKGQPHLLRAWNAERELRVLEAMVASGPAVDGVTRRREATVDGIPFLTYIQPWEGIRRLLGLE
jgi:hypothetical protein